MTVNKQDLLKRLEQNWNEEQERENELTKQITNDLISELKKGVSAQLRGIPTTIEKALKIRLWTGIFIGMIVLGMMLVIGITSFYSWNNVKTINNLNQEIELLKIAKENYQEIQGLEGLGRIEIVKDEKGSIYLVSKSDKAETYESKQGFQVLKIAK